MEKGQHRGKKEAKEWVEGFSVQAMAKKERKQKTYLLLLLLSSQNVRGLLFERRHEGA